MKYNELNLTSHKNPKRVGRGIAAGQGKTAGRGTKGQKSRTGSSKKPGFAGGSNPIMQRLPKLHGFRSYKAPTEAVTTAQLDALKATKIDNNTLFEARLVSTPHVVVKLILNGEITKKLNVTLQGASEGAIKAIEKTGGTFTKIDQVKRVSKKVTEKPAVSK